MNRYNIAVDANWNRKIGTFSNFVIEMMDVQSCCCVCRDYLITKVKDFELIKKEKPRRVMIVGNYHLLLPGFSPAV
jgi:hypothetical protein